MANCITRHIPNAVTCCNLFSGCIASVMAFNENYTLAISFIILGAVFDFFDGMLARLFKVSRWPMTSLLGSLLPPLSFLYLKRYTILIFYCLLPIICLIPHSLFPYFQLCV